jgi:PleD family two-component response regulator
MPQGVEFANRLRRVIESSPVAVGDLSLGIAASFGVGVYQRDEALSEKEFVERVDGLLYLAKEQGRNRVCHTLDSGAESAGSERGVASA